MNRSYSKIRHMQNSNLILERRHLNEQTMDSSKESLSKLKGLTKNVEYIFIPQEEDYTFKVKGSPNIFVDFSDDISKKFTNQAYFNKFKVLDKNSLQNYKLIVNYPPKSLDEISENYPILLLQIANPKDGNKYPIIYVSSADDTVKTGDLEITGDVSQY